MEIQHLQILVVKMVDGAIFRHEKMVPETSETLDILMVDLRGIEPLTS